MPKKRPKADDWADPQGLMLLQSWAQQGLSYAEICANMARVRGVPVSERSLRRWITAYPDTIGKVRMRLRLREEGMLEILVRYWGVGIPDVEQARAPLYTTGGAERAGMGFTIMDSFMDRVKVRSQPGKGTSVTLTRRIRRREGR